MIHPAVMQSVLMKQEDFNPFFRVTGLEGFQNIKCRVVFILQVLTALKIA